MRALAAQAYGIARAYLESERQFAEQAAERISSAAISATFKELSVSTSEEHADATGELLSASIDDLMRDVAIQIERDIATLLQSVRKSALAINISARAQDLPLQAALVQYHAAGGTELKLAFTDRAGRRYPSRKFVRTQWRQHLLNLYNEIVLSVLAEHGLNKAKVVHADPKADSHGMEIALIDGSDLPTYAAIRSEIFHPNADAVLAMVS
jgi:hypothetical protein